MKTTIVLTSASCYVLKMRTCFSHYLIEKISSDGKETLLASYTFWNYVTKATLQKTLKGWVVAICKFTLNDKEYYVFRSKNLFKQTLNLLLYKTFIVISTMRPALVKALDTLVKSWDHMYFIPLFWVYKTMRNH